MNLQELSKDLNGFTAADLSALMYNAHLICIQHHLQKSPQQNISNSLTKNPLSLKVWDPSEACLESLEDLGLMERVSLVLMLFLMKKDPKQDIQVFASVFS